MLYAMLGQGKPQHFKEDAPLRENIGNLQGCFVNTKSENIIYLHC